MPNTLYYGDNLAVLREIIRDESVDLIYLDPPFNSNASYNVLFHSPTGISSQAQVEAFEDTWHWGEEAESAFNEVMRSGNTNAADLLRAIRSFLGDNDMMAYLAMMAVRIIELHRVLKPTGSIYLHCDPTASHYLKMLLDAVFRANMFRNEIVWQRTGAHGSSKRFAPIHDIILFYTKTDNYVWNPAYMPLPQDTADAWFNNVEIGTGRRFNRNTLTAPGARTGSSGKPWRGIDPTAKNRHWAIPGFARDVIGNIDTIEALEALDRMGRVFWPKKDGGTPMLKLYLDESKGVPALDVWTDIRLQTSASERLGYPTQKPLGLLERIISASSNPGDVVLDPFCGCGTAVQAAEKLSRRWIGIDVTHLAISLIERRLADAFPGIAFEVHGTPSDIDGARDLAARDKYQFQWWAVSLIEAQPYGGKKKGADGGIDGLIYFRSDAKTTERAVVSVKGGGVSVNMVRDLKGVLDRERAPIGVFLTLEPPTRPMEREAASAGFYELGGRQYPRLQIITIEQALNGSKPAIPLVDTGAAFRRAPREGRRDQTKLDL